MSAINCCRSASISGSAINCVPIPCINPLLLRLALWPSSVSRQQKNRSPELTVICMHKRGQEAQAHTEKTVRAGSLLTVRRSIEWTLVGTRIPSAFPRGKTIAFLQVVPRITCYHIIAAQVLRFHKDKLNSLYHNVPLESKGGIRNTKTFITTTPPDPAPESASWRCASFPTRSKQRKSQC